MSTRNAFIFGLIAMTIALVMLAMSRLWLPETTVATKTEETTRLLELRAPATGIDAIEMKQDAIEESIKKSSRRLFDRTVDPNEPVTKGSDIGSRQ
jgi:hypothetical protein